MIIHPCTHQNRSLLIHLLFGFDTPSEAGGLKKGLLKLERRFLETSTIVASISVLSTRDGTRAPVLHLFGTFHGLEESACFGG
jgi:hypothetical protein